MQGLVFMKKFKKAALLLVAVIVLSTAGFLLQDNMQSSTINARAMISSSAEQFFEDPLSDIVVSEPKLACRYYMDNDFKRSIKGAEPVVLKDRKLIGGIVSHHLLADSMIAPFFATMSVGKPDIVFIVGPNHKRTGQKKINTGYWDWQTPNGVLESDSEAVNSLVESCQAGQDFNLLETEHSVSSLVPYVKYYMPEAKIVPVLLHGNLGIEGSKDLALKIRESAGSQKWIVIGSIDFSHYLPPDTADKMDEITLKAIETSNLEAINRMGNDNLDSPPSVMTLLEIMRGEGKYEIKVTGHTNSAEIAGIYSDSTTSYFTMLFYQ